jgi:hypothetical protein
VLCDIVDVTNRCLVDLKPYVEFIGREFKDIIFDLKCMLFQSQMDQKMQTEEEDFNAMLTFENS